MKILPILTAALIAGAGTLAWAQTPPAGPAAGDGQRRAAFSRADFDALTDARIAAIQAGLKLNPDQQKLWGPVEQALRISSADRVKRIEERRAGGDRNQQRQDLMERLERRAELATESAQRLTALTNAMKPFWASLDENQKRLLPVLMRPGSLGGRGMAGHRQRMGMMEHHGPMEGPRR